MNARIEFGSSLKAWNALHVSDFRVVNLALYLAPSSLKSKIFEFKK